MTQPVALLDKAWVGELLGVRDKGYRGDYGKEKGGSPIRLELQRECAGRARRGRRPNRVKKNLGPLGEGETMDRGERKAKLLNARKKTYINAQTGV